MERIGIYGGSFNPPHLGHIRAAAYARAALDLDRVLLIPAGVAPHKPLPPDSPSPEQRLEMLTLASADNEAFQVSDIELRRDGPSYTCETLEELRRMYPEAALFLLMGTDMLLTIDQWRSPETIMKNAALAAFCRGEKGERQALAEKKRELEAKGARVYLLDNPVLPVSSTDLRRMAVFQCAGPFLSPEVEKYILEQGLYGAGRSYRGLSMEQLEQTVIRLLAPGRVAHVLGCRDTAAALAKRYGADETDAARAGLLHDITKALDGPLQLTLCREYGIVLDDFSAHNPKTLHALTGSLVAERIFGENQAVVSAIRSHTTGKANMNILEKILYVADYMEPNRKFTGVQELRELAWQDIDKALKLGLEMTLDMLRAQNREISGESQEALRYLQAQGV